VAKKTSTTKQRRPRRKCYVCGKFDDPTGGNMVHGGPTRVMLSEANFRHADRSKCGPEHAVRGMWDSLTNGDRAPKSAMPVKDANRVFSPLVQQRLLKARERLDYTSYGLISRIAKEIGIRRQYAHAVIKDKDTFDKYRGETARKVWFCLEKEIKNDENVPVVENVVDHLRRGDSIQLKIGARFYNFLVRRLHRIQLEFTVVDNGETPATYTFIPKKAQAPAAADPTTV
jgi:hypothetical protein